MSDTKDTAGLAEAINTLLHTGMRLTGSSAMSYMGGMPFAILPDDHHVQVVPDLLEHPRRINQCANMRSVDSFMRYYHRFAADASLILAYKNENRIGAVLDYHEAPDKPRHASHIVELNLQPTDEWEQWISNNDRPMTQVEFAEFVEEHVQDIASPDAADLYRLVTGLTGTRTTTFGSSVQLENGNVQLHYAETSEAKAKATGRQPVVEIPKQLKLALAPFDIVGQERYGITARFRYREKEDGKLTFFYKLDRPEKVLEDAFAYVRARVEAKMEKGEIYDAA